MTRRDHADSSHTAEDRHPYPPPVVAEVTRVHLSTEDGQDQGQDCQQVDLSPKLQDGEKTITCSLIRAGASLPISLHLLLYFIFYSICITAVQITSYLKCAHLQHYSRKHRRAQVHNSPGCRQRCLHSPTTASDGKSSLIGGTRTGDTPQNTTCTPGTKTHSNITGRHLIHSQTQALLKLF